MRIDAQAVLITLKRVLLLPKSELLEQPITRQVLQMYVCLKYLSRRAAREDHRLAMNYLNAPKILPCKAPR